MGGEYSCEMGWIISGANNMDGDRDAATTLKRYTEYVCFGDQGYTDI